MKFLAQLSYKIILLTIIIFYTVSFKVLSQNAITLDPNTTGTNQARTLSEGVGSTSQFIPYGRSSGSSIGFLSYLGLKSYTSIANANSQTAIYGFSDKSTTINYGIVGSAEAMNSANAYGSRFSAFGNTTNSTYGLYASAHNEGLGSIYSGYFAPYNRTNEGRGFKYGVYISNNVNYNDTTTANGRYGLYSSVSGKSKFSNYGIYSSVGNGDTVTTKNNQYAIYGNIYEKNISSNYGLYLNANNLGTGSVIAGQFNVNSGSNTSTGDRIAVKAINVANNNDTTTVNIRYGVHAIINGRAKYGNVAIYGENSNYYSDTLTSSSRTGVYGGATGKSKGTNIGVSGYAHSSSGTNATLRGVSATAQSNGNGPASGGEFYAFGDGNNSKVGVKGEAQVWGSTSNTSSLTGGQFTVISNANNWSSALYAYALGTNSSSNIIRGLYSTAVSDNVGNTNPTYGIYTQAQGASPGIKYGIYATSSGSGGQFAGYFQGDVHVNGNLSKSGGTFKIDHPQDPESKYLVHSFVESPEMKNIYDGTITTDLNGDAIITMPNYFQALNVSFRYQLTCIGQFAQAIVSEEISKNSFKIKTDKPNVKVSWQVTGVRNDEWAKANPIVVEQAKTASEKGKFLNPEVFKKNSSMALHSVVAAQTITKEDIELRQKALQTEHEADEKYRVEQSKRAITEKLEQEKAEAQRAEHQKRMEEENKKNEGEVNKNNN